MLQLYLNRRNTITLVILVILVIFKFSHSFQNPRRTTVYYKEGINAAGGFPHRFLRPMLLHFS